MSASSAPVSSTTTSVVVAALEAEGDLDTVLTTAMALAQTMPRATLHLSHVIHDPAIASNNATVQLQYARTLLEKALETAQEQKLDCVAHVTAGKPAREVLQLATDLHADVIIVGTRGRTGVSRLVMGSVAENVVRNAQCAVVVARKKDYSGSVPEIEPACPDCLATQRTGGTDVRCPRHSDRVHAHGHVHYEVPPSFGVGSFLIRDS